MQTLHRGFHQHFALPEPYFFSIASLKNSLCVSILNRDFMVNLDVASRVSGTDTIIFSADGRVLLCSEV
ncbi:MAG: hypothetical protein IJ950_02335, partial [Helicobacter sp.]|nr:hypothetical protein [Helicobacter sp.]